MVFTPNEKIKIKGYITNNKIQFILVIVVGVLVATNVFIFTKFNTALEQDKQQNILIEKNFGILEDYADKHYKSGHPLAPDSYMSSGLYQHIQCRDAKDRYPPVSCH